MQKLRGAVKRVKEGRAEREKGRKGLRDERQARSMEDESGRRPTGGYQRRVGPGSWQSIRA